MDAELEANIQQALPSALKMALYAANKQYHELLKYTIEGVDSLCNNAAFLKDLEDQEHLQQLDETAKDFAVLETQLRRYKAQLKSLEPLVESGRLEQSKIDKLLKSALAKPRVNASKHDFYKKFCDRAGVVPVVSWFVFCGVVADANVMHVSSHHASEQQRSQAVAAADQDEEDDEEEYVVE
ncbi:unnamed protein product [Phytophthora fragariaefolia]|uniref:Unnamed protein product n=1 Tax=Phytophthora fragariaefolia TaxID=1490495 RepID=A0A9W6XFJ2_9STRA|nr:unnamed protein product [Phytophthora fragariaefolia]